MKTFFISKGKIAVKYPINTTIKPLIKSFFDEDTNTVGYVVKDPDSAACAVIDSVMVCN